MINTNNMLRKFFRVSKEEISFELKERKHYKKTTHNNGYGSRYEFYLNKDIIQWIKENDIRCHWRKPKIGKFTIYFLNADDAMRFKLIWG
jgi:hypothetical protein